MSFNCCSQGRVGLQEVHDVHNLIELMVTKPVTIATLKAAEEPRPMPTGRWDRTVTVSRLQVNLFSR
jgi:hypothetical protein